MKYQVGDLFVTKNNDTVLIVDIDKSGLVKGIFSKQKEIHNIGYDRYITDCVTFGR